MPGTTGHMHITSQLQHWVKLLDRAQRKTFLEATFTEVTVNHIYIYISSNPHSMHQQFNFS